MHILQFLHRQKADMESDLQNLQRLARNPICRRCQRVAKNHCQFLHRFRDLAEP